MTARRDRRTGLLWATFGGGVLAVGILALVMTNLTNQRDTASTPSPVQSEVAGASPTAPPTTPETVVDAQAVDRGWVPEPVTLDPAVYAQAALEAVGTFDTTQATYDEWVAYLGSWFTPDTRYSTEDERLEELAAAKREMSQSVILPESEWTSLAREDGRVATVTVAPIDYSAVPQDTSGDMSIATADLTIAFTRNDDSGNDVSYADETRLSVQIMCGADTVPTPDTRQQAGDCKVVRFFAEPVEG